MGFHIRDNVRNLPVRQLFVSHIGKPMAKELFQILLQTAGPRIDLDISGPSHPFSLWAVCRNPEHISLLRAEDILLQTVQPFI